MYQINQNPKKESISTCSKSLRKSTKNFALKVSRKESKNSKIQKIKKILRKSWSRICRKKKLESLVQGTELNFLIKNRILAVNENLCLDKLFKFTFSYRRVTRIFCRKPYLRNFRATLLSPKKLFY